LKINTQVARRFH